MTAFEQAKLMSLLKLLKGDDLLPLKLWAITNVVILDFLAQPIHLSRLEREDALMIQSKWKLTKQFMNHIHISFVDIMGSGSWLQFVFWR